MSAVASTVASIGPWALIVLVALFMIFLYALVRLVITKRQPQAGDEVIVRVFPPKIEVRYRDSADQGTRDAQETAQVETAATPVVRASRQAPRRRRR